MNKIIFKIVFLVLLSHLAYSQGVFKGYLVGGVAGSQVDGDTLSGYDKGGLIGGMGLYVGVSKNKKHGVSLEGYYIQKGVVLKIDDFPVYRVRLNYVEFPFLYNYNITDKGHVKTGLGVSYMFSARAQINNTDFMNINDLVSRIEVPFIAGVEYEFLDGLSGELRWSYSLTNISAQNGGNTLQYWLRRQSNNVLQFLINIKLSGNQY